MPLPNETPLDIRLHAYRADLADIALKDRVEAMHYVEPTHRRVTVPAADLKSAPNAASETASQLLLGEEVALFETRKDGWSWVQSHHDGYVGYVRSQDLTRRQGPAVSHRVVVPRTFVYPTADMKTPPVMTVSAGSLLAIVGEETRRATRYGLLTDGKALIFDHLLEVGTPAHSDPVVIASRFVESPYLWGGRSGFGLDCSGLVQLSFSLTGRQVLRDTDMQAGSIGRSVSDTGHYRRGDLIFWKGHVALVEDGDTLIHANGRTMSVAREPIAAAIARIEPFYGRPIALRRS